MNKQTDRQTDEKTDRQTNEWMNGQCKIYIPLLSAHITKHSFSPQIVQYLLSQVFKIPLHRILQRTYYK